MSIKNGLRKSISLFIVIIMLLGSTPMSGFAELEWPAFKAQAANDAASEELILDTGNKITRAQWLHNLAVTFDMSVEDEAYPDNYFSDLESTHQYYYDVLLNVNFGVIDIEAGANVEPDGLLTRSFASQTLNYCLGFQLENANYTFSDYASCDDPDDAQIAVNRGWFSLVDGKFCPENFVTDAEVGEMMTDAKSVLDSRVVDENYESAYTFDTSVVEIPDGTEVSVDENIVEITACSKQIKSGSKFAIYQNGIPKIYEAVSVSTSGAITTVTVNPDFDGSSLFLSIDAQGVADASEFDIVPDDDTTITVDEIEQAQSQSSARKKAKGTVNLKKIYNFDKSIDFGDGISIKCNISMENPKVEYTLSTNPIKARVVFIGNATVNFNGNFDLTKAINLNEIPIGEIGIPGIGGLKLCVDLSLAGSVGASTSGNLRFGFNYSSAGFSIERNFNSKSFYLTASANASAGLSAKFGIDTPIAEAGVFFKIGGKAAIDSKVYTDGKKPMECANFSAFLYCSFGMKAAIKLLSFKEEYNNTQVVWDMKTSPIKIARHYEDGKEVSSCLRGSAIGYFTPWNSIYGSTGWSEGFGSTGYDRTGKPFAIYEYEVKKDEHENEYAVITKYSGNATSLYIPQTLDGYTIKEIGNGVFKNKLFRAVVIPDTVVKIDSEAFRNCRYLSNVVLSKSLESLGAYAFGECDSLVSIEIPKSLKQTTSGYIDGWRYGVFSDSNNLKNVTFEEGTTIIANHLFRCNNGIEKIVIPDTVTSIGEGAFEECESLSEVVLSNSLETIGSYAFKKTPLHEIKIPDSVKEIRDQAFRLCNNLSSVTLSRSLETIGAYAFGECDSLVSIKIPKSLKQTTSGYIDGWRYGVFSDSNNLKNVTFEEGTTIIANHLFRCNNGIEKIVIPDTVTSIGEGAFEECRSLNEVVLSNSLETVGSYAFKKTPLHEIKIPDSVKEIRDQAFRLCNKLSSVTLSRSLETIGAYAFGECDSLVSIEIPKSLKRTTTGYIDGWRYGVFSDSNNLKNVTFEEGTTIIANHLFKCNNGIEKIVIPDTVTFIKDAAFQSCTNLKEVILPNHLEKTEGSIFDGCSSLENISIPDSVTSIGDSLFRNCTSLTNVELLCRIDKIPKNMFQNCTSLESITIPETVNKIYPEAFRNCDSLESIEIPDAVTGIDNWAFAESDNLKTVKLNSSLDFIGNNAFRDCDALETIKIPNSVTTVSDNCFYDCDNLKNVELSLSLKEIKYGVFEHCDSLESIVIPQLVGKICDNAFKNCVKLAKITIPKSTTEISTSAFSYKDRLTIFGVSGSPAETFAKDNDYKFVAKETPVESVVIPEKLTMNNGSKVRLVPTITPIDFTDDVVWKTGNKNVVTVDETGLLKAVSSGTAKVKLCIGDITATCEVTVFQPVTAIYLNSSMSLEAGETKNVNARVNPSNATNKELAYASSDSSIASVDENGNVTAHKKGKAVITVTALDGNGAKGTCEVTVLNTYYDVTDIDSFESSHNYPNNCSDIWSYTKPGAGSINVTFDERTYVEEGFDYIKIYDANNNEVGTYTGDELAGKTITITGNTVKIKLISDDGGTDWGFKVVGVYSDSTCTDHVFEDTVVEPTCTTSGYTIHTCSVCGYNYKDVTPSLGHNIIIDVEAKDATCTENGTTEGVHCSRCDYRIEAVAIKAKGHTEKVMPAVSASCSRTGLTEGKKCSVCGKILVAQTVIERTEHSYEVVVVDPTCTTDGYTTHKCSVCGYSYTDNAISAFGHTDEDNDGECDRCGETIDESVDPSDPDNPIQNCKCACHKTGIAKFFFKIGLFFQKLFKKNQICKCGVWHY